MTDPATATGRLASGGGHHGRIARVDLTSGAVEYGYHDPTWYRRYGGGGALALWYLLRDVPSGADALGPHNVLVVTSSIVAGVDAPALSKHAVLAKSPQTGGVGESQSVSPFGPALATSGVDAVVISGVSDAPCYLVLRDGAVRVEDATQLWGLETADAHDKLVAAEGADAHTSLIGPAGEHLVRYASIVNDVRFMCCRTGLGAVMGSKRLKGLVALPTTPARVADPDQAQLAIDDFWTNRRTCTLNVVQEDFGVGSWLADTPEGEAWPVPTRNFRAPHFESIADITGARLNDEYARTDVSPPPNIEYARRYAVSDDPRRTDPRYGGLEVNTMAALGPLCGVGDLQALLAAAEMTYRFGLDPESLGGTIAWAMESAERGALPANQLDGLDLRFGDADALLALTEGIAHRRGAAGELLAEGSARAARVIGAGSEAWLMTVKDKELPPHEPRNKPGLGLGYGAGPIGPDYCIVEHDWDYSTVGFPYILEKSRAYGMLERNLESDLGPRKVRQVVQLHRWWSGVLESLLFDLFGVAPARYMPPTRVEQLLRGITGWDLSLLEVMLVGERRIVLMQEFNRREGLSRDDDLLPPRCHEPLPSGAYAGAVIDADEYGRALGLYYAMCGFDAAGRPTDAKLHELELGWVVDARSR